MACLRCRRIRRVYGPVSASLETRSPQFNTPALARATMHCNKRRARSRSHFTQRADDDYFAEHRAKFKRRHAYQPEPQGPGAPATWAGASIGGNGRKSFWDFAMEEWCVECRVHARSHARSFS